MNMTMNPGNGINGLDLGTFINSTMNRNRSGSGWGDGEGGFLWILLVLLLGGGSWGGGWGNRGAAGAATDVAVGEAVERAVAQARAGGLSDQVVIDAVRGNRDAITQLASTLNCDISNVQTVLCGMDKSILSVANQVGMSSQQIINAIQAGNCQLASQLAECCCSMKTLVTDLSYNNRIQNMEQTTQLTGVMNAGFNLIGNKIDNQTLAMNQQFQAIKDYFTSEKISALQLENSQLRQTNTLQAVVDAATTPIQNRVETLLARSMPNPVPAYPATQYATGYTFGIIPTNNCCQNNCGC